MYILLLQTVYININVQLDNKPELHMHNLWFWKSIKCFICIDSDYCSLIVIVHEIYICPCQLVKKLE